MSHPRRRLATVVLASLLVASCLAANALHAAPLPPQDLRAASALSAWADGLWPAVAAWLGLPAAVRYRAAGGGAGSGPRPTCDEGPSIDPNGHCVPRSSRPPVLRPTCDAGPSIDPNGQCAGH